MEIPAYPEALPIDISMACDLRRELLANRHGVSEFTFAGLYLFGGHYRYRVSRSRDGLLIVSGEHDGRRFFALPCGVPADSSELDALFAAHDYLKNLPEGAVESRRPLLERAGYAVVPDRDNFDYLYRAADLSELSGKKLHKKRNHVNGFLKAYNHRERPMDERSRDDALGVLEQWRDEHGDQADYPESREALMRYDQLGLSGIVVYAEEKPVAFALGEPLVADHMYVVHVEKAISGYRGAYQFVNKAFAEHLSDRYEFINREQDLGEEGIRQAKMTYRPCGFVEKYRVAPVGSPDLQVPGREREGAVCCRD